MRDIWITFEIYLFLQINFGLLFTFARTLDDDKCTVCLPSVDGPQHWGESSWDLCPMRRFSIPMLTYAFWVLVPMCRFSVDPVLTWPIQNQQTRLWSLYVNFPLIPCSLGQYNINRQDLGDIACFLIVDKRQHYRWVRQVLYLVDASPGTREPFEYSLPR